MKDFLTYLTRAIVDHPDKVAVDEQVSPEGYKVLNLTVDPSDMGKVIGKSGRIIKAVRDLVRILAIKENARVNVVLTEV